MNSEDFKRLEATLWSSADTLRANSDLKSSEYSTPVLGLIFLKFADNKYQRYEADIQQAFENLKGGRREKPIHEIAIEKCGFYLPDHARYDYLLNLPEEEDIAKAIKEAMVSIEQYQDDLRKGDVLPKDEYNRLVRSDNSIPKRLLQNFAIIPADASGDMFGKIYEYFLGKFALAEGQGGGEFFTPQSVVRLMVEIIEPYQGRVLDPACGSGGMFVQSAKFIEEHRKALAAEGVRVVKGVLEGWEIVKFIEALNFKTGKLNSNAAVEDGKYPFFTCSNETFRTNTYSFDMEAVLLAGNNAAGIYPLKYYQGKFDVYQRTYVVTPKQKELSVKFIYFMLKDRLEYLQAISIGAATQFLTMKMLNSLSFLSPRPDLIFKFESIIGPIFHKVAYLKSVNENLVITRDRLLSRLISGKLSVADLDIQFPPSMT